MSEVRFFRPELGRILKAVGGLALEAIVVPVGSGYEQRPKARTWQEIAYVYRLRELARETNLLVNLDRGGSTGARLRQLGPDLETRR